MRADAAATDDTAPIVIGMMMPAGVARDLVRDRLAGEPDIILHDLLSGTGRDVPPITAMDVVLIAGPGVRVPAGQIALTVPATRFAALDLDDADARMLMMTTGETSVGVTPDALLATVRSVVPRARAHPIQSPD